MAKDDSDMKYPLIITYDEVSLVDVTVNTPRIAQVSSCSVGMGSDVLEVSSISKSSAALCMFEIGSSSSNNIGSSVVSHVLTPNFSNSPSCDDIEGYLVDPNKLDDIKKKYMFANKILLQRALGMFAVKNYFEFETVKSSPDRLVGRCTGSSCL